MGSQPRAQQRPEALSRVDMDLMEAIPIFVTGVFALAVTHRMMVKAAILQRVIDRVFIGMNPGSRGDKRLDEGRRVACWTFSSIRTTTAPPR